MAKNKPTKVKSVRHKDKRKNIPTEELRDFVTEDENAPKTMLYPRDPSLDPQLVWKGKDQQDARELEVPVVPVYIQEKIHPHAIVEDLRRRAGRAAPDPQMTFFDDFNGIEDFEQKVDFYHHDANWSNRMILGDSLLVMTSLAEKEALKGKVQTIYIDPPYGIKFGSNWQVSTRKRDVKDGKAADATRQPEQIRAFRDTWKLGIHSYLAYMRDRLVVARELLTETGSLFVQIGDENVHLVRCLMDEVFGADNFQSLITVRKTGGLGSSGLTGIADFVIWYAKDATRVKFRQLYIEKVTAGTAHAYSYATLDDGQMVSIPKNSEPPPNSSRFQPTSVHTMYAAVQSCLYEFEAHGKRFCLPSGRQWSTTKPNMLRLAVANRLFMHGNTPRYVRYLKDFPVTELTNIWADLMGSEDKVYVVQTTSRMIQRCVLMASDPGDLVLDPTCGSGTTAYVAEQWGRRWITIDTSRVALALARTRLMAARFPYYLLADSPEGMKKEAEIMGRMPMPRGTGFQPVRAETPGPTTSPASDIGPVRLPGRNSDNTCVEIRVRRGAYLPHWTCEGGVYAVTFRLADSLPQSVLAVWVRERDELLRRAAAAKRPLTPAEVQQLADLRSKRVETFLNRGHGECHLKEERAARIVRDALLHFDGERYDLVVWCVMPNHVHAVLHARAGFELPDICHSWKSFSANAINRTLGRKGTLWQPEPYDHLIRDEEDYRYAVDYVLANPEQAGLVDWTWVGRGTGFQPVTDAVFCSSLRSVLPLAIPGHEPHGQDGHATCDIKKGFVYKRVPHITLRDIANNEEIDAIHQKWQEKRELVRANLNRSLGTSWEEWEVPRELSQENCPQMTQSDADEAKTRQKNLRSSAQSADKLLKDWWNLRKQRQEEIDASIARNADQELLYDQPYKDNKCVRVTGPFTVESLSPHRTISVEQKKTKTIEFEGVRHPKVCGPDEFGWMIIENLKKAGVQNRVKQERLKFDTLEPYPGEWIHAVGEYTQRDAPVPSGERSESPHPNPLPEGEGVRKRVAVCIGPEHGTVGPELVKEAAKEAVQGVGFDLLAVCGFAFDPHVDEETKRYGKLEVLVCRMNPDLSMGDELLKKTGAGNLFMIFGEPDISIDRDDNGQVVVEIRGLDVYDPTTGQIRSESTDDIACWFIDTDYDGESFFVRHAYFTGADEPYAKLKRALRAEIDEAAWSALYSTKSQPFDPPKTGNIAVKVINHYGDEVLKVYRA